MSDKSNPFVTPALKVAKTKRPSTVNAASSSRMRHTANETLRVKDKHPPSRAKINKNLTVTDEADFGLMKEEGFMPNFDAENRQIALSNLLRAMLEECLGDEKIERQETEMDLQMGQLADRFQQTFEVLDKTSRRLKDVSFVVEQKRLLDLKNKDSAYFYEKTDASNAQNLLQNLASTEQDSLDKLDIKNIDLGYNKDSGHKQLLDAVNEAIEGLEQIKIHSNLDLSKFKEYEMSKSTIEDLEKGSMDLDDLKTNFDKLFPAFNEKLFMDVTEKIAKTFVNDDN